MKSPSKQVAFLKQSFKHKGGLEKYCLELSRYFCNKGYRVSVLTAYFDRDSHSDKRSLWKRVFAGSFYQTEIEFYICTLPFSSLKLSFLQVLFFDVYVRLWKKKNPQAILFGFDRHFIPLSLYRAGNGCHYAYLQRRAKEASLLKKISLYFNPLHWVTIFSEKKTYCSASTHTICNSYLVRNEILKYYPHAKSANIHVIHNGVDWKRDQLSFEEAIHSPYKSKKEWNVPESALHIIMLGHEWFRKGADILIEAIPLVIKELPQVSLFFTIAGKEKKFREFQKKAEGVGVSSILQLIPKPVNAHSLLQSGDISVIPSRYDPFANVTLESLSMGLWTVTSIENGGSEVLDDSIGYVAKELSPKCIAEGIIHGVRKLLSLEVTKLSIRHKARVHDFSYKLEEYINLFEKSLLPTE